MLPEFEAPVFRGVSPGGTLRSRPAWPRHTDAKEEPAPRAALEGPLAHPAQLVIIRSAERGTIPFQHLANGSARVLGTFPGDCRDLGQRLAGRLAGSRQQSLMSPTLTAEALPHPSWSAVC